MAMERLAIGITGRPYQWIGWHRRSGPLRQSTLPMPQLSCTEIKSLRQKRQKTRKKQKQFGLIQSVYVMFCSTYVQTIVYDEAKAEKYWTTPQTAR